MTGGNVWVESERGKGSTFCFTPTFSLNAESGNESVSLQVDAASPTPARPLKLLLAEDYPVNRLLATRVLEKQGHKVTAVANGQEAVEISASLLAINSTLS